MSSWSLFPVLSRVVADRDPKYWLKSALLTDDKPDCVVPLWGERSRIISLSSSVIIMLAASPAFTPPNWLPGHNLCPVTSVSTEFYSYSPTGHEKTYDLHHHASVSSSVLRMLHKNAMLSAHSWGWVSPPCDPSISCYLWTYPEI